MLDIDTAIQNECNIQFLSRVKELIERGWCQRWIACDENSNPVSIKSGKLPAKFSLLGALIRAEAEGLGSYFFAYNLLMRYTGEDFTGKWNDAKGRTKEEVIEVVDKAIALSKGKSLSFIN